MSGDTDIARRKFLAAASSGIAAIAGCSDSGTHTQNSPTSTGAGDEVGNGSSSSPTSDANGTDSVETTADQGSLETDEPASEGGSNGIEPYMEENGLHWIEVEDISGNISMPSDAYGGDVPEGLSGDEVNTYEEFVNAAASYHPGADEDFEIDTVYIAFSEVSDSGFDEPHRRIQYRSEAKNNRGNYPTATVEPFEDGVLERFLDENVHGVADHSEDIDSELLEYARQ